jgi:hypothetical protein
MSTVLTSALSAAEVRERVPATCENAAASAGLFGMMVAVNRGRVA